MLGIYEATRNHPLGDKNLRFTHISDETREWIAGMVAMKVQSDHIVRNSVLPSISNLIYTQLDILHGSKLGLDKRTEDPPKDPARRKDFITMADVRRIEKTFEVEGIRLDRDDAKSTMEWAHKLDQNADLLAFKSATCPVPEGSGLAKDTFCFAV